MKICVYCGSRIPKDNVIKSLAVDIGSEIGRRDWAMVFGGGKIGMMGLAADACIAEGGEVIGVIPTALKKLEVAHTGISKLHETQDMHTRKALMESLSDAFVVLPGGFGTLDEFFEILTWRQLSFHSKKIVLININGYFDGLLHFADKALTEDFIQPSSTHLFEVVSNADECFSILDGHEPDYY